MSSEDRNYANMLNDSDSGDEVSDKEESDELLGATGNNHHGAAAGTENETSVTLRRDEKSATRGSDQGEKCSCISSRPTRLNEALQMRCMLCGGVINGSGTNREKANKLVSSPTRMGGRGPLIGVVPPLFAVSPLALPSTSLEDNTSEQEGGSPSFQQRAASLVTGRSREEKTPVQNVCEHSVQSPSPGMRVRMFLFERTHQERNEKWYILYIIPAKDFKVFETIRKSFMDTASQQGYNTRQIPFAVDNGRSEEFHTVYVQEQITVSFQLQSQLQENFVALGAGREFVFRVPVIQCESKNRVTPGAKSHFRVEYVGGPGKLVQEQGKITLVIDSTQCTLLFSISIWVPD